MTEHPVPAQHQNFIDWMKATGMLLIVIGHVMGDPQVLFNAAATPIYTKQLGVAFFVFIAGWGLASVQRPRAEEAFRRLFPILLFGGACALLMSALKWWSEGDLNESNYLPLFLGVNVFLNYFPANPTTWYIGMYLHLIVLWWWFMPSRVSPLFIVAAILVEWLLRAALLGIDRPFTAYMLVSNWLLVFLLGHSLSSMGDSRSNLRAVGLLLGWLLLIALWMALVNPPAFDDDFPTRLNHSAEGSVLITSALVTLVYAINTLSAFFTFRSLGSNPVVRFVARNTLLIFILHMPLIWAFAPHVPEFGSSIWPKKILVVILVTGSLGLLSEIVNRLINVNRLRDRLWTVAIRS